MIVRSFRQDRPAVFLFLLFTIPLLSIGTARTGSHDPFAGGMPLYRPVEALTVAMPWASWALALALVLGIAIQLARLANDAELFERRNQLPMLLFPIVLAQNEDGFTTNAALCGMPLVIWAFSRAWSVRMRQGGLGPLMDAGLLIGLAAMVYLPYAFLVVAVWASNAVLLPFHWRDHVVPVVGMALVFYLFWGVLLFMGMDGWDPMGALSRTGGTIGGSITGHTMPPVASSLLFLGATLLHFVRSYRRSIMRGKNIRSAFLALALALVVLIAFEFLLTARFPPVLIAAPLAVLFAYPLLHARSLLLAETGAWLLCALAIWMQWGGLLSSPA